MLQLCMHYDAVAVVNHLRPLQKRQAEQDVIVDLVKDDKLNVSPHLFLSRKTPRHINTRKILALPAIGHLECLGSRRFHVDMDIAFEPFLCDQVAVRARIKLSDDIDVVQLSRVCQTFISLAIFLSRNDLFARISVVERIGLTGVSKVGRLASSTVDRGDTAAPTRFSMFWERSMASLTNPRSTICLLFPLVIFSRTPGSWKGSD